jgi:hypothetical protein
MAARWNTRFTTQRRSLDAERDVEQATTVTKNVEKRWLIELPVERPEAL